MNLNCGTFFLANMVQTLWKYLGLHADEYKWAHFTEVLLNW